MGRAARSGGLRSRHSGRARLPCSSWPHAISMGSFFMGSDRVIYPTAEAGGLQLTRNDEVAACGLMTEARQNRSPAAEAPSGAYVKHFTLAPFPASNPLNVRLARCGANRCPP